MGVNFLTFADAGDMVGAGKEGIGMEALTELMIRLRSKKHDPEATQRAVEQTLRAHAQDQRDKSPGMLGLPQHRPWPYSSPSPSPRHPRD
jgi:hypothetical protein